MTTETSLKVGTRVRIDADEDGQDTVEYGTIVEPGFPNAEWSEELDGRYIVKVDRKYREGPNDDGVRDVLMEYITVLDDR